jgi:quinol monooxygenase YgiN
MSTEPQVIVTGWIDFEPGDRSEALRHFAAVVAESRREPGCLDYAFLPDPELPGRVRVFEHWDSDASLTEHLTLPHVLRLRSAIAPLTRTGRSMTHHTIAASRPMGSAPTPTSATA